MWSRVFGAAAIVLLVSHGAVRAQRHTSSHPDLQGAWNGATLTPLQRPAEFKDRAAFTPAEAAEYVRTSADRLRRQLPTDADRATQIDIDDTFVETEQIPLDGLRTSLIVEPVSGVLPPLLPTARARPTRSREDPETSSLAERCLLGNFNLGGSLASPPIVPSAVIPAFFQIVQTDGYVMIVAEWMHDARIIRMNSRHASPGTRRWLGDSIGFWDGPTLVVDTTNFRPDVRNLGSGERLHVVERFTKVDERTLRYRVTVEDPDTWATPWTAEWPFRRLDARILPVECHEANYSMTNILRGARAEEARR